MWFGTKRKSPRRRTVALIMPDGDTLYMREGDDVTLSVNIDGKPVSGAGMTITGVATYKFKVGVIL